MSIDTPTYTSTGIAMKACQSSQVKSFGYDPETRTLAVRFVSNDATYHYADVDPETYLKMDIATSVGGFFTKFIRDKYVCTKQPNAEGIVYGLQPAQEPKYTTATKTGRLVNRATGKPIPDFEPVFVIRAQDKHAVSALRWYRSVVQEPDQIAAVDRRIKDFEAFAAAHPDRMKEPDDMSLAAA